MRSLKTLPEKNQLMQKSSAMHGNYNVIWVIHERYFLLKHMWSKCFSKVRQRLKKIASLFLKFVFTTKVSVEIDVVTEF